MSKIGLRSYKLWGFLMMLAGFGALGVALVLLRALAPPLVWAAPGPRPLAFYYPVYTFTFSSGFEGWVPLDDVQPGPCYWVDEPPWGPGQGVVMNDLAGSGSQYRYVSMSYPQVMSFTRVGMQYYQYQSGPQRGGRGLYVYTSTVGPDGPWTLAGGGYSEPVCDDCYQWAWYDVPVPNQYVKIYAYWKRAFAPSLNRSYMDSLAFQELDVEGLWEGGPCEIRPDAEWYDVGLINGAIWTTGTQGYRIELPPYFPDGGPFPTAIFTFTPPITEVLDSDYFYFIMGSSTPPPPAWFYFKWYRWCGAITCTYTISPAWSDCDWCLNMWDFERFYDVEVLRDLYWQVSEVRDDYDSVVGLYVESIRNDQWGYIHGLCPLGYGGPGEQAPEFEIMPFVPVTGDLASLVVSGPVTSCYTLIPSIEITGVVNFGGFELCLEEYEILASLLGISIPLIPLAIAGSLIVCVVTIIKAS